MAAPCLKHNLKYLRFRNIGLDELALLEEYGRHAH